MKIFEVISDEIHKRLERKIIERIQAGVSALHHEDGWTSGSFVTDTSSGEVRVFIESENDGQQATVYATNEEGSESRHWSIPTSEIEDGLESTAGAVYDVTYGDEV